jgi:hypothetical protein
VLTAVVVTGVGVVGARAPGEEPLGAHQRQGYAHSYASLDDVASSVGLTVEGGPSTDLASMMPSRSRRRGMT